ncbi:hypothetical protein IMCC21224_14228 [Puniceibacterium sp. IMCC21224]|nr:hypothetical protein IMCC21224_14228 [Puniceibacterium sp. IMCC21224]
MPVDVAIGHPWLRLYPSQPVRHARDAALAVFTDMLLADPAHGDVAARTIGQCQAKNPFGLKQALGMLSGQSSCLLRKTPCDHWGFPEWHR